MILEIQEKELPALMTTKMMMVRVPQIALVVLMVVRVGKIVLVETIHHLYESMRECVKDHIGWSMN